MDFVFYLLLGGLLNMGAAKSTTPTNIHPQQHSSRAECVEWAAPSAPENLLQMGFPSPLSSVTPSPSPAASFLPWQPMAPTVTATKTVSVTNDVAPLGLPSPGDQLTYVVEITNTGNMDAPSINFLDILDPNLTLVPGSLRCSPVPMPDAYDVFGNVKISVPVASGVLANDQNPCGTGSPLQVTTTNTTGTQGQVMMNPDGSFTFNPASGFNGTTTFTYTATNGVFAKQGTVTLNVSGRIWFIDNSQGTNGDGRLGTPYNSLANFNTGASGGSAGDIIFLYRQTATNYSGAGLMLKNNQYLIGQGASSSIATITGITLPPHSMSLPATSGTNPVIAHSATAVTLASGNQLHGFNVSNTGGTGINGTSVGNLKIRDLSVANSGGTALNLASGALDVIIKKLDASNATTGFALSSTTGSFTVEGTGTTDGSGGTIQTITQRGADIQTATNITLKNMTFTNANTVDAGGVGTCDVTTTLACHGALYLRNITTIELNNIDVNGVEEQGLNGHTISAMNMTDCSFTNCGDEQYEGCVKIRELSGTCFITNSTFSLAENELVEIFNTTATTLLSLSVTGSTFSNTFDKLNGAKGLYFSGTSNQTRNILVDGCTFSQLKSQGVYINASAGTLNADVTDCTFTKGSKKYMDGVHIFPQGTATANINILRNAVTTAGGAGILVQGSGTSSVFQARINQNMVTGPHGCGDCLIGGGETVNCNCYGDAITVWATENSSGKANVNNNTITGIDDSGRGVYALARNQADLSILISGNNVSFDTDSWYAYDLFCGNTDVGTTSTLCAHLTNNTLSSSITSVFSHVRARAITNVPGSTSVINLQSIPASATMANVWNNNGNTPLTTAGTFPVTVSSSSTGAGTETITFNHPGCDYTLTHPTALSMPAYVVVQNADSGLEPSQMEHIETGIHAQSEIEDESEQITASSAQSMAMMDMVTVSGFTLPATTGSIYIDFKATINNPFPQGVCSVSNQGTVSGSNFSNVLTDNPFVAGAANPTVTTVYIAPEITSCPSTITKNNDTGQCTASTTFSAAANTGCPTPTITYKIGTTTITSPYNFPVGTTTVTVIASNSVSPNDTCMFNVVVTDAQAPDITCLSGTQTRGTNLGNCTYTVSGTEFDPTVNENCPGFTLTNSFNNANTLAGAALPTGTTVVTWTISDGALLTDMCTVTIQVTDDDAPTLTCPAAASTPCNIADLPPYADLTAFTSAGGTVSDNCGINNASFTMLSQTGGLLSYTRTYQIADMAGNTATCTQTVTVSDNVNPTVTPGTIASCYPTVAAAEAAAIAATTATDNCGGTPTKAASTVGTCTATVTVTATDAAGNMASTTYNTRIDNTAPVATAGTIAACYPTVAAAEAAALAATTATDNCPGTLTETAATVGTCMAVITVTTSDICGNSTTTTYNTSIDNAGPTVMTGTIAACYPTVAAAEAAAIAATTAMDDCPSNIVKTASTVGDCSAVVTVTATDACGNSASTTYDTRIDGTAPSVTSGIIAACYPTVAAAEAAALAATTATDNCPGTLTETASTVGTCSAVITVTTTDGCGNSTITTYSTRIDNTAPVATAGTIAACYPTVAAAEAAALAATTATDNCPGTLAETAATVGDCSAVITVTTTDGCGNSTTTTYNTRIDNTAPVATAGTIAACYPTVAAAEAAALAATTATDNCPGTLMETASTVGTCSAVITVTTTDGCGNSTTTTYNTRIDNTAPVATAGTIAACYPTIAAAEAAALAATTATDNCPGTLTETAATVGTCSAVITVTTSDICGNSTTTTYNTSIDNAGPTVTTGTIASCYPTVAAAEAAAIAATTAMDDCPSNIVKTASTVGTCSAVVTVTATDACGNSASTTYNTRIDNTAPVVTQGTIAACYQTVAAAEAAALAATTATDNCPGALMETAATVGACSAVITVTTTDGCGNSASVTYNTRIDNESPMGTQGTIATCYPTVAAAEAAAKAATTWSDNCSSPSYMESQEVVNTTGTCSASITVTTVDECGNPQSVTYNTRIDNTPPVVTQGAIAACYQTVAAAEAAALAATSATDNCPGSLTETASTVGTCSAVITVTTTDFCGNSTAVTYNTRIDNTPPMLTAGNVGTFYPTIAAAEAAAIAATTATDNCPGTLSYSASTQGQCSVVITVTATDGCGNSAFVTYQTSVDNTPPTVSCLNPTISFNGEQTLTFDADDLAIAADNCGIQSIAISQNSVTCLQFGQVIPVTVTVTDFVNLTATCTSMVTVGGLPCGWSQNPNGVNCENGNNISFNASTGVYTATSTGCFYGPPFSADATAFAQRTLCGNGSITARVTGINPLAGGWAGIVMRENNTAGAKKVQLMTNLGSDHRREFRTTTNGSAQMQQFPSQSRYWLRITRVGNQFTMFVSSNGVNWFPAGAQTIVMGNCIQMGLVATNYTANSTVTATFAGVSFTDSNPISGTNLNEVAESIDAPHGFEVYPNPTNGELNVDLTHYVGRAVRFEVYSLEGKLLQFNKIDEVQTTVVQMNMSDLTTGMYLIKVKSAGLPDAVQKVVLQRK